MKKLAFVTPDLKSGGSERVAARLTHLFGDRYEIYYIVFDDSDISYNINAELINLDLPPSNNKLTKVVNTFRRAAGIARVVKEKQIDAVVCFTPIANRAMRFAKPDCAMVGACRGYGDLEQNTADYHKVIAAGATLLFNSREMQEFYLESYPDDRERCTTVENLLDLDRIIRKAGEALPDEHSEFYASHRVVSAVGILSRHKGHWDLFKAFELLRERVPDAGLVLVGHRGQYEEELKDMAARNRYADDILLVGYQSNPFRYVAKSAVFALSSISEGFPNALIEAMACSVPCVSTSCKTGAYEIMYNDYRRTETRGGYVIADNGILTPTFDGVPDFDYANKSDAHRVFADALERMMTDRELAQRLVASGRERAARNDEQAVASQYFELIEKVTN